MTHEEVHRQARVHGGRMESWDSHDRKQDGHPVKQPAAGTADGDASSKTHPAWDEWRPRSVPHTPTSKAGSSSIAQQKGISNQQNASVNIGRAACRRMRQAIYSISDFVYESLLKSEDCWNYDIDDIEKQEKRKAKQAAKRGTKEDEPQLTLAMSRVYFDQVRRGFDISIERLRRNPGIIIYTDDPPDDYEVECKGVHPIGKSVEQAEFMRSIVQVLPHVTSDEDCRTCPPPMDRTDLERLHKKTVKLVLKHCAQVEVDPEKIPHASDEFQNLPSHSRGHLIKPERATNYHPQL